MTGLEGTEFNGQMPVPMLANNKVNSMNADQVKSYIANEVQKLGDAKVKPLISAINEELALQRRNNEAKAALDKQNSDSNERITKLQAELGAANQAVNDLAVKLAEATASAANNGQTSA